VQRRRFQRSWYDRDLHFHDTPEGIVADVFLAESRVRMPVSPAGEQAELLARIDDCLTAAGSRARAKARHRRGRRGGRRGGA